MQGRDPLMSSDRMDWQTPEDFLDLVRKVAPIYLDPATSLDNPTRAQNFIAPPRDALAEEWPVGGLCYVNPPYGRALSKWAPKIAQYPGDLISLVPARTETKWFQALALGCSWVVFWGRRIKFKGATSGAPFPSAVFYKGADPLSFLRTFAGFGMVFPCPQTTDKLMRSYLKR